MSEELFVSGCLLDPTIRDAAVVELMAAGRQPICANNDTIRGSWERLKARGVQAVLMPHLMAKYFPGRRNDFQLARRPPRSDDDPGTCVARGTYRAATLTMLRQIDEKQILAKPVVLAYEFIYGYGRTIIGKSALGNGGGMYGSMAAKTLSLHGAIPRAKYESTDLSVDNPFGRPDLAKLWGTNRKGPPADLIAAANGHTFDSHLANTSEEAADALACGFAGAFSRSWATTGRRDQNGMVRPTPSAHCETLCGIFQAHNGEDGYLHWQSWGDGTPSGPNMLKLRDGSTYELPIGCSGVYRSDMDKAFRSGDAESWHFELREGSQWR